MASWRVLKFVTTNIWLAVTVVDILITPPCGNTIIVPVSSSKGSVGERARRATSVTREPWTFTGTSSERASARKVAPGAAVCFGGALVCEAGAAVVEFATSRESLMSGAIVLSGSSTPSPGEKAENPVISKFSWAVPLRAIVLWYLGESVLGTSARGEEGAKVRSVGGGNVG